MRKKSKDMTLEEMELTIKLLCDQSKNHLKVHAYDKALRGYNQNIHAVDKEQELLQGFMRVGLNVLEEPSEEANAKKKGRRRSFSRLTRPRERRTSESREYGRSGERRRSMRLPDGHETLSARKRFEDQQLKRKKPKENFVDFYTDKDRAAAVSAGAYDIKQSLQIKQKQDRSEQIIVPEEADINSVIALGLKEMKNANPESAIHCFTKALELNATDVNALVSRSKCFLLLGEASKALIDAETALIEDKNSIRAIYQKAESLYYLGQFEQSLMYFHRGLRARPELASFRLGVQKTQEAIQNTIGGGPVRPTAIASSSGKTQSSKSKQRKSGETTPKSSQMSSTRPARPKPTKADMERRNARKLLGELCVDKEYLENLLKHPDLVRADTNTENISTFANEAVEFLNKRQEFWRQQRPCTALPNHKNLPGDVLLKWF